MEKREQLRRAIALILHELEQPGSAQAQTDDVQVRREIHEDGSITLHLYSDDQEPTPQAQQPYVLHPPITRREVGICILGAVLCLAAYLLTVVLVNTLFLHGL